MITSPQNPRVKQAVRLRDHRQRRKEQLILIDGARELARAIGAGVPLREVSRYSIYSLKGWRKGERHSGYPACVPHYEPGCCSCAKPSGKTQKQ